MATKMETRWQHPFSAILAGPSGCGKTFFIKNMLDHAGSVFSEMPQNIVWCYSCWQHLYKELQCKYPIIQFVQGLPDKFDDDELLPPNKVNLLVIDDLMVHGSENRDLERVFTQFVHHRNLSVFFITQNIFCKGKSSRTISLNAKYMVLFKNPRDKLQIATLARQMYPGNVNFFMEVFADATNKPHGYLVLDLNANTPDSYRLRTGLFPPDLPVVYIMKKNHSQHKRARF